MFNNLVCISRSLYEALVTILSESLPHSKIEKRLFVFAFLSFFILGIFWQIQVGKYSNFTLLGYDVCEYTFGERLIPYKCLFFKLRHPLFAFWLLPFSLLAYLPEWLFDIRSVLFVFTLATNLVMALSVSLVWRICSNVNPLSSYANLVFTGLYFSFAQTLVLSFAVESFPFSVFIFLTYISFVWVSKCQTTVYTDNLFFAMMAGITITNGLKFVVIQLLLIKDKLNLKMMRLFKSSILFIFLTGIALLVAALRYYVVVRYQTPTVSLWKELVGDSMAYVIQYDFVLWLKMVGYNFFVSPMLLCVAKLNLEGYAFTEMVLSNLSSKWILPLLLFYSTILSSIWFNRRHVIVQVFVCFLSVDILVHFIMGYGLNEGYIYSGHWLFMFPILCALLANRISAIRLKYFYSTAIFVFSVCLLYYNVEYLLQGIANM